MIQAANAFAVAAHEAGLESIVQMSQWTSSASASDGDDATDVAHRPDLRR
jgi:hypothetical protein